MVPNAAAAMYIWIRRDKPAGKPTVLLDCDVRHVACSYRKVGTPPRPADEPAALQASAKTGGIGIGGARSVTLITGPITGG
jgi:hypothetical protein